MMNKKSGLLAVSGISSDARDIREGANHGDENCLLAFDMYAYKAMLQAASMIASMAGVDTITFTAGIGENDWTIRQAFCECFDWLGVRVDRERNQNAVGNGAQVISAAGSPVTVMVIPTDEEYMIALDVKRLTEARRAASAYRPPVAIRGKILHYGRGPLSYPLRCLIVYAALDCIRSPGRLGP